MNETKSVKALKKQLAAAIAMVTVAAVALGSSTYAWFVSNNEVKATTSTISAQSNSAFMTIANGTTGASASNDTAVTTTVQPKKLYPARVKKNQTATFESAYGKSATDGTEKNDTAFDVGTADEAVKKEYAVENDFNISAKGNNLKELKVEKVELGIDANNQFDNALRVLIVCDSNWEVWSGHGIKLANGTEATSATVLAGEVKVGEDTVVKTYIYYDGDEKNEIYTNNLGNLEAASNSLTINFTATSTAVDNTASSTPGNTEDQNTEDQNTEDPNTEE